MKTYNVLTPNPMTPAAGSNSLARIFLLIVLAAVAVVAIRWWGESRMEARYSTSSATVQMTASATPAPTPTPQAPQLALSAESVTLDTGLGYNLDYRLRTVSDGVVLTDPDGDMWSCTALPATHDDWQSCKYVGTVQE